MSDDIQRLVDALDAAIPPHSDALHDTADGPLVELAQDLVRLEVTALPDDALDRIEAQVLGRVATSGTGPPNLFRRFWWLPIIALIAISVGLVVFGITSGDDAPSTSPTESVAPAQNTPTVTQPPSSTDDAPSIPPTESAAPTHNTPTVTQPPSSTALPPSPVPISLTLEGEIEVIRVDSIVIYGVEIRVSEEMLADFRVGDMVRVQATATETNVFVAVAIEYLTAPTPLPAQSGGNGGGQPAPPSGGDGGGQPAPPPAGGDDDDDDD